MAELVTLSKKNPTMDSKYVQVLCLPPPPPLWGISLLSYLVKVDVFLLYKTPNKQTCLSVCLVTGNTSSTILVWSLQNADCRLDTKCTVHTSHGAFETPASDLCINYHICTCTFHKHTSFFNSFRRSADMLLTSIKACLICSLRKGVYKCLLKIT